ncbi:golgin subfamily A member 6-like protein 25 [Ptychodera flava]|uniref:golgin subfamily A member 6-like protein 25 n=1 Tax=Ptychodera flava TaxID=63121 RepID=UPI00396A7ECA
MEGAEPEENVPDVQQQPAVEQSKSEAEPSAPEETAVPEQKAETSTQDEKAETGELSKDSLEGVQKENRKLRAKYKKMKKEIEELKSTKESLETELLELKEKTNAQAETIKTLEEKLQKCESESGSSSVSDIKEKAKQTDGLKVQADYLTRQVLQTQESETYLRQRLAEALEAQEESERKMKDLQVRLKRFIKDDQTKDERIMKMEQELKDITQQVEELEKYVDADQVQRIRKEAGSSISSMNGRGSNLSQMSKLDDSPTKSKVCTIL